MVGLKKTLSSLICCITGPIGLVSCLAPADPPEVMRSTKTGRTVTIHAQTGVPQGDALSALLAVFALTSRLTGLARIPGATTVVYIDGIIVITTVGQLAQVFYVLHQDHQEGCKLNAAKTSHAVSRYPR